MAKMTKKRQGEIARLLLKYLITEEGRISYEEVEKMLEGMVKDSFFCYTISIYSVTKREVEGFIKNLRYPAISE